MKKIWTFASLASVLLPARHLFVNASYHNQHSPPGPSPQTLHPGFQQVATIPKHKVSNEDLDSIKLEELVDSIGKLLDETITRNDKLGLKKWAEKRDNLFLAGQEQTSSLGIEGIPEFIAKLTSAAQLAPWELLQALALLDDAVGSLLYLTSRSAHRLIVASVALARKHFIMFDYIKRWQPSMAAAGAGARPDAAAAAAANAAWTACGERVRASNARLAAALGAAPAEVDRLEKELLLRLQNLDDLIKEYVFSFKEKQEARVFGQRDEEQERKSEEILGTDDYLKKLQKWAKSAESSYSKPSYY